MDEILKISISDRQLVVSLLLFITLYGNIFGYHEARGQALSVPKTCRCESATANDPFSVIDDLSAEKASGCSNHCGSSGCGSGRCNCTFTPNADDNEQSPAVLPQINRRDSSDEFLRMFSELPVSNTFPGMTSSFWRYSCLGILLFTQTTLFDLALPSVDGTRAPPA